MTCLALITGILYRAPEARTSKTGKPFVLATVRLKEGDSFKYWKVFVFSETAQAEILRLREGDALSARGALKAELYRPEGAEPRLSLSLTADQVLPPTAAAEGQKAQIRRPAGTAAAPESRPPAGRHESLPQRRRPRAERPTSLLTGSTPMTDQMSATASSFFAEVTAEHYREAEKHAVIETNEDSEIARLAALAPVAYDRERESAAERLGCRILTLDKAVDAKRKEAEERKAVELCADTEPCAESVNVGELLYAVRATITQFIVCEPETAAAASLWVAFTWIIDHVNVAPLAIITAPEKGCGKTQLLDVIGRLSRRALFGSNISPAATFRVIEAKAPTLLIDEADAFFRDNEELRGVINSGHTRTSAYVIRTVGDDHEVRQFSTWSAKAIAGIGRLPETVMSRGIILNLRRKLKNEKVGRLRHAEPALFEMLARKLARFGLDYGTDIGRARPALPEELGDRQQDNWEPLLAIADLAGGSWPREARRAALALCGAEHDAVSTNEELLKDIRDAFDAERVDRMAMAELLRRLVEDETAPWATWNRGKLMTARQLGAKLKEFGIHAVTIHLGAYEKPKGFKREQFVDAWARYLDGGAVPEKSLDIHSPDTPLPSVTQSPPYSFLGLEVTEEVTDGNSLSHHPVRSPIEKVTDGAGDRREILQSPLRSPENPMFSGQGDWVTDGSPVPSEKGVIRI